MGNNTWGGLINRVWFAIPSAIIDRMDGKTKRKPKNWITALITALIAILSAASITNLSERAHYHHAGFSAYLAGFGLAALVPIAVICAVYLDIGGWKKAGIWAIAVIFAVMSAAIQVRIYAPGGLAFDSQSLEALAFGAGIPLAEILLATLDGILINHFSQKAAQTIRQEREQQESEDRLCQQRQDEAEEKAAIKAKTEREESDRLAREQQEWQAEQDRKVAEWQAEQDRKAAEHAQKLELERTKAEARLHKTMHKDAQQDAQDARPTTGRTTPDMQTIVHLSKPEQAQHLHTEGFSNTEISQLLNVHRNSVGNWLKTTNGNGVHA